LPLNPLDTFLNKIYTFTHIYTRRMAMGTVRLNADVDENMAMALFHALVDEKLTFSGWLRRQIAVYLEEKQATPGQTKQKGTKKLSTPYDLFNDAVRAGKGDPMKGFSSQVDARNVIGRLWNYGERVPDDVCALLGILPGSTYAKAVRPYMSKINVDIRSEKPGSRAFLR
jgi:hypothetical protein